ncbi:MAG: alcohol dehydrogenase class IV [Gammaproteobacteria bacterium]|jgi:alcohol dehydrogenase class IV
MSMLEPQDWSFPVPITYDPGRLAEIADFCSNAGMNKPILVTDRGSRDLLFIASIMQTLKNNGLSCDIYSGISPNPRGDEIAAGRQMFRQGEHDGILAVGGGSGMDGGKAIVTVTNNDIDLRAFEFEQTPPDMTHEKPFPLLICIPTTADTGTETEGTAMITKAERKMKLCTWHPQLKPALELLDTVRIPLTLTGIGVPVDSAAGTNP